MTSCTNILGFMHSIIDTLPSVHDIDTMYSLMWSMYNLFVKYISQCYFPTISA